MEAYEFEQSAEEGNGQEKRLDNFFDKWYSIVPVNMEFQKMGIDRIFTRKDTYHTRYTIEYKSDKKAASTGNVFIETVSVDSENKPGWAYTCGAQMMIYFIPPNRKIYIVNKVNYCVLCVYDVN